MQSVGQKGAVPQHPEGNLKEFGIKVITASGCSGTASSKWHRANTVTGQYEHAYLGMVPKQQSRNYSANAAISNPHWNLFFCCSSAHLSWRHHVAVEDLHLRVPRWSIWKLQCVQNFSAYTSPPKSKMQNAVYYKIYLLRLIIYDTYTCNMFPSVRSSIGGLLGNIIQHLWNCRFLPCTMTVCRFPKLTNL